VDEEDVKFADFVGAIAQYAQELESKDLPDYGKLMVFRGYLFWRLGVEVNV
jgi:hypothetical protein